MKFSFKLLGKFLGFLSFSFIALLWFSLSSSQAHLKIDLKNLEFAPEGDPKKTIVDYWTDLNLKYSPYIQPILTTQNCYSKLEKFFGCWAALDAALAASEEDIYLVPTNEVPNLRYQTTLIKDFGSAQIVMVPKGAKPKQPEEEGNSAVVKRFKAERKADLDLKKELFLKGPSKDPTTDFTFENALEWAETEVIAKAPKFESFLTGETINAYLGASEDPHTRIMPTAFLKAEQKPDYVEFFGIGMAITAVSGRFYAARTEEQSPARAAGILPNDEILSVEGTPVKGLKQEEVVAKIRGDKNTKVTIEFDRKGNRFTKTLKRQKITVLTVIKTLIKETGTPIGHIYLRDFMDEMACQQVADAVVYLEKAGAKGLILDLRGNGGGSIYQAACIAGMFLGPRKPIVREVPFDDETKFIDYRSLNYPRLTDLPLVVLVDQGSASASEIVSGSLQAYRRALITGTQTFGKATVQGGIDVPAADKKIQEIYPAANVPGTILLHTRARYYVHPSLRTPQNTSVTPDAEAYPVPDPTDDQKVAMREVDSYENSIASVGPPLVSPIPAFVKEVNDCIAQGKVARVAYAKGENDPVKPDFQLLMAQETVTCTLEKMKKP